MEAGEKTGAGSGERDPPRLATFPAPTPDGVSATGARRRCGIRLARRERTDGEGEGRDRRTGTGSGNRETGKVARRAGRSALRRREPGSQARDRSTRGTRAGEQQVPTAVRGSGAARGGTRRGHRTGKPGTTGPAVGRNQSGRRRQSRPQLVERPRECDRLADVGNAADPRHGALQAEPEPRVHERAVFAEVQVPAVRVLRQLFGADAGEQLVVVVLTLAAADDLPVPLGGEHVVVEDGAGVRGILLHIEGFHCPGIVEHQHRPVVLLRQQRLGLSPQVLPPFDVAAEGPELRHGIRIGDARERRPHRLEWLHVALELGQLGLPALERARHDIRDELLLQRHVGLGVVPRDLGLHHPELRQVATGLRFLGSKRGSEAVHLPERGSGGLDIELPRLREVRGAQVEIFRGEQVAGRLADRPGEDRRVHQNEMLLVEEVADRLDHLVAHPRDRHLAPAPEPEVAVLEQERGAVLLRGDREVVTGSHDPQVRRRQLDAARGARVGAHGTADLDRGLLSEPAKRLPRSLRDVFLREHNLQVAGAVTQRHEPDLARGARGHDPPARDHRLTRQRRQLLDAMEVGHRGGRLVAVPRSVNATPHSTLHIPHWLHPTLNNSNPRSYRWTILSRYAPCCRSASAGSRAMISPAARRADSSSGRSVAKFAYRNGTPPDWRAPASSPMPRSRRSSSAILKPSVVSVNACSRGAASGMSDRRMQWLAAVPRPTRPRSWCSCASPNRSACSISMTVAFATSIPTSMTLVATRMCTALSRNARIVASRSSALSRPCTRPTSSSGNTLASRSAITVAAFKSARSDSSITG